MQPTCKRSISSSDTFSKPFSYISENLLARTFESKKLEEDSQSRSRARRGPRHASTTRAKVVDDLALFVLGVVTCSCE